MLCVKNRTHYSLLNSVSKPDSLVDACNNGGYTSAGIIDNSTLAGCVKFSKKMRALNLKPVLGTELNVINGSINTQSFLAKNLNGWKSLIKLVSRSYDDDLYDKKPRIDKKSLADISSDLITLIGSTGTELHKYAILNDEKSAENFIAYNIEVFGKDNVFVELDQLIQEDIVDFYENLANRFNLSIIPSIESYYPTKNDFHNYQLICCTKNKTNIKKIQEKIVGNELRRFLNNDGYVRSIDEIKTAYPKYYDNLNLIEEKCGEYDITGPPQLPKFDCPNGISEMEYLTQLCREGWKKKNRGWDSKIYGDRVRMELAVLDEFNLAGYFLIVQDYIQHCKKNGWIVGVGRGSAAGSLVSNLLDITNIDPIKYNLMFERFFNPARKDSYPDIDADFQPNKREDVIKYITEKYGENKVSQIITFSTIQGASAIQEVMRVNGSADNDIIREISKKLPKKESISDELEEQNETSIIRWTLNNIPSVIEEYCYLDDNGELKGEYAKDFKQAIDLEGIYKNSGKHAAGLVITSEDISTISPIVRSKDKRIAGMEMKDLESIGCVKFDILGLACLEKLGMTKNLIKYGSMYQ